MADVLNNTARSTLTILMGLGVVIVVFAIALFIVSYAANVTNNSNVQSVYNQLIVTGIDLFSKIGGILVIGLLIMLAFPIIQKMMPSITGAGGAGGAGGLG